MSEAPPDPPHDVPPPEAPPAPPQNPVPPGDQGSNLKEPACSKPETRCFICELRALAESTPETKGTKLGSAELAYNIVGIRRRNSVSDKFDDFMAVFTKLATGDNVAAIEKRIEKDYLDAWKEVFGKAKDKFRLAPCTTDKTVYAVGLFDNVSTDPGLTEDDVEKLEHLAAKSKKAIDDRAATIKTKKTSYDAFTTKLTAQKEALDKLPEDPAARKGVKAKVLGPRGNALKSYNDALIKDAAFKKEIDALEATQTKAETDLATTKSQLAAARSSRAKIAIVGSGEEGGIEIGRAQVPPGVHTNAYAIGIHHGGKASTLPKGHTAFVCEISPKGFRYFSADYFMENGFDNLPRAIEGSGGKLAIARMIHKGSLDAKPLEPGSLLTDKGGKPHELEITSGGKPIAVEAGDTLVMRSQVDGCNLHRGHNAKYDEASQKVVPGRAGGDRVKGFSEGCQVYQEFDAFNAFLRLGQVTKRFTCMARREELKANPKAKEADKNKEYSCGRLVPGSGSALSAGELSLERRYGKSAIRTLELDHVKGDRKEVEDRKKELAKKQSAWTPAKATELAGIRAKTADERSKEEAAKLGKLEAEEWTTADDAETTRIQTRLGDLDHEKSLLEAETAADAAKKKSEGADEAVHSLEEKNAKRKDKEKLEPADLEKKNQKAYDTKRQAKKDLDAADKNVSELKKLAVDTNHFLRERCGFFGADYLRECDVSGACPQSFTYTLVEADDATSDGLVKRFKATPNVAWDGSLSLKKS